MTSTAFTRHAGIEVPLICGAMYPCSNPELVAAVSTVHGEIFGEIRPASTMVVVAALIDPRWKVEVELDAVVAE